MGESSAHKFRPKVILPPRRDPDGRLLGHGAQLQRTRLAPLMAALQPASAPTSRQSLRYRQRKALKAQAGAWKREVLKTRRRPAKPATVAAR